ncbi:MAG: hypothetical protein CL674_02635 [Bdellovibrionaceae bacterium]|nr:hypothetical protein [Pseudobdellovibrionaceae bacterium]|tara:strand:- start:105341 stop:107035 length:1695 start_codon:yes stop_codon:yes gene_type:complete
MNFLRIKKGIKTAITCSLVIAAVACNKSNNTSIKDLQGPAETGGGDAMRLNMVGMEADLEKTIYERHMLLGNFVEYFYEIIKANPDLGFSHEDAKKYFGSMQSPELLEYFSDEAIEKFLKETDTVQKIIQEVPKLNRPLILKDGPCLAKEGDEIVEREASADYPGQICFSLERLAKTTRYSDLTETIDALLIHELTHKTGIRDEKVAKTGEAIAMLFTKLFQQGYDPNQLQSTINRIRDGKYYFKRKRDALHEMHDEYINKKTALKRRLLENQELVELFALIDTADSFDIAKEAISNYLTTNEINPNDELNQQDFYSLVKAMSPSLREISAEKPYVDYSPINDAFAATEEEKEVKPVVYRPMDKKVIELVKQSTEALVELKKEEIFLPINHSQALYQRLSEFSSFSTDFINFDDGVRSLVLRMSEYMQATYWLFTFSEIINLYNYAFTTEDSNLNDLINSCQEDSLKKIYMKCKVGDYVVNAKKTFDIEEFDRLFAISMRNIDSLLETLEYRQMLYLAFKLKADPEYFSDMDEEGKKWLSLEKAQKYLEENKDSNASLAKVLAK